MNVVDSRRRVLPTESGASLWLFVRSVSGNGGCPAPPGDPAIVIEHTTEDRVSLSVQMGILKQLLRSCSRCWPSILSIFR